jgi:hypothetical protein
MSGFLDSANFKTKKMIPDQSQKPGVILSGNEWIKSVAFLLVGIIFGVLVTGLYFKGKLE